MQIQDICANQHCVDLLNQLIHSQCGGMNNSMTVGRCFFLESYAKLAASDVVIKFRNGFLVKKEIWSSTHYIIIVHEMFCSL